MEDASPEYAKYKTKRKKFIKEHVKPKLHIIKDPLNYIMPEFLNTYDKISLRNSSTLFDKVELNKEDFELLYKNNKKKLNEEAREQREIKRHMKFRKKHKLLRNRLRLAPRLPPLSGLGISIGGARRIPRARPIIGETPITRERLRRLLHGL